PPARAQGRPSPTGRRRTATPSRAVGLPRPARRWLALRAALVAVLAVRRRGSALLPLVVRSVLVAGWGAGCSGVPLVFGGALPARVRRGGAGSGIGAALVPVAEGALVHVYESSATPVVDGRESR